MAEEEELDRQILELSAELGHVMVACPSQKQGVNHGHAPADQARDQEQEKDQQQQQQQRQAEALTHAAGLVPVTSRVSNATGTGCADVLGLAKPDSKAVWRTR